MTVMHAYCDRCANLIERDRTALEVTCGPLRVAMPTIDVCRDCLDSLRRWLASGPDGAPAAPETPPRFDPRMPAALPVAAELAAVA